MGFALPGDAMSHPHSDPVDDAGSGGIAPPEVTGPSNPYLEALTAQTKALSSSSTIVTTTASQTLRARTVPQSASEALRIENDFRTPYETVLATWAAECRPIWLLG